jgi:ParB family chromosome partitioning protein
MHNSKVRHQGRASTLPLSRIHPRPHDDTRHPDPSAVVRLAESIAVLGLLEPIVVDGHGRLVAGLTRLQALKLLAAATADEREAELRALPGAAGVALPDPVVERARALAPSASFDPRHVPVRMLDLDAETEPALALAAEIAENDHRRDYTPAEIRQVAERLRKAGFVDRAGRPREGEQALRPALSAIVGKSLRTIERILSGKVERRGRPRIGEGRRRTLVLSVDASLEKEVKALAVEQHRSVSAVAREVLRRGLEAIRSEPRGPAG